VLIIAPCKKASDFLFKFSVISMEILVPSCVRVLGTGMFSRLLNVYDTSSHSLSSKARKRPILLDLLNSFRTHSTLHYYFSYASVSVLDFGVYYTDL
jgi:hypothetical protein